MDVDNDAADAEDREVEQRDGGRVPWQGWWSAGQQMIVGDCDRECSLSCCCFDGAVELAVVVGESVEVDQQGSGGDSSQAAAVVLERRMNCAANAAYTSAALQHSRELKGNNKRHRARSCSTSYIIRRRAYSAATLDTTRRCQPTPAIVVHTTVLSHHVHLCVYCTADSIRVM